MRMLVLNPGSSSIKFSLFEGGADAATLRSLLEGELSGIGTAKASLSVHAAEEKEHDGERGIEAKTMDEAVSAIEGVLEGAAVGRVDAVGYRVVHPGPRLKGHQRITPEVMKELKAAVRFAPLHDPAVMELIEEMMRRMPQAAHVACFDTVFHETMPYEATVYALPKEVRDEGVRRYGFHGLSCESVIREMREALGDATPARVVIAHLGSGCSVTACVDGRSVDTTMGLTPTGGVVMGTRPGDLDPGLVLYLLRRPGATADSVERMLNRDAGLKALGGVNDMRELRKRAAGGDADARLAIAIFTTSVARAVAGMLALYRGEAVVFTGGIGEHDRETRAEVVAKIAGVGILLDRSANDRGLDGERVRPLHTEGSRYTVYCAAAEEDRMIARHVVRLCAASPS